MTRIAKAENRFASFVGSHPTASFGIAKCAKVLHCIPESGHCQLEPALGLGDGMVRRRHVFYIAGYDPQGAPGYYRLFQRELARFQKLWPVNAALSELEVDADGISARWRIEAAGPDWCVETTYELLRWDDIVARNLRRPIFILLPRTLICLIENALNGTIFRTFRAGWRFGVFYLGSAVALWAAYAAAIVLGWLTYLFTRDAMGNGIVVPLGVAIVAGGILALLAQYMCTRWFVTRLCDLWIWHQDLAHGRCPDVVARIDDFARRIIAKARAGDADEVLVVGHSAGATVAVQVMARALELASDFTRAGSPVTMAALGSTLPLAALHPNAHDVREAIRRVAVEPSLIWIDCRARKDMLSFQDCNLVHGHGVDAGPLQCNPLYWNVRFRDGISSQFYSRLRWNFLRMHFQYIMANDQRAPYDYFMIACGPIRLLDWARDARKALSCFAEDASYMIETAGG
jgi:pimeloyl-ACP methyl ester carboxylesterase